jgi:hypothetical protein
MSYFNIAAIDGAQCVPHGVGICIVGVFELGFGAPITQNHRFALRPFDHLRLDSSTIDYIDNVLTCADSKAKSQAW